MTLGSEIQRLMRIQTDLLFLEARLSSLFIPNEWIEDTYWESF